MAKTQRQIQPLQNPAETRSSHPFLAGDRINTMPKDCHYHKDRPTLNLGFCPFSLAIFAATAASVVYAQRQRLKKTLPACRVVFVLGGPGSGKGTQCQLLSERYGWTHLSAGDLLRAARKTGGPLGDQINDCISQGKIVPSHVTCQLVADAMREAYEATGCTKFLVDGYPRSQGNVDAWTETMSQHSVDFCLYMDAPEEVLVGRLLERAKTSGRSDDSIEVIRKRLATNRKECEPIVAMYEKENKVRRIAADQSVEQVFAEIEQYFKG